MEPAELPERTVDDDFVPGKRTTWDASSRRTGRAWGRNTPLIRLDGGSGGVPPPLEEVEHVTPLYTLARDEALKPVLIAGSGQKECYFGHQRSDTYPLAGERGVKARPMWPAQGSPKELRSRVQCTRGSWNNKTKDKCHEY